MADTCKVWDYIYSTEGLPLINVQVSVVLSAENSRYSDGFLGFVVPEARNAYTDASGYFEIDIIPSSGLAVFSEYKFLIPKLYYSKLVAVPDASGARLSDL